MLDKQNTWYFGVYINHVKYQKLCCAVAFISCNDKWAIFLCNKTPLTQKMNKIHEHYFFFWLDELHCTSCSPGRQQQSQQTTPTPNYIYNDTIHAQCRHAPPTILTTLTTKNGKLKPKRSAVFPEIVQQTDTKKAEFKMSVLLLFRMSKREIQSSEL